MFCLKGLLTKKARKVHDTINFVPLEYIFYTTVFNNFPPNFTFVQFVSNTQRKDYAVVS
jgi:hypothetical protein